MNKEVELLSPAGDMDCVKAAVQNGADCIYFGASLFSARASAKNFDLEELEEVIIVGNADAVADLGNGKGLVLQKQTGAVDAFFGDVIEDGRSEAVMAHLVKRVLGDAELTAERADGEILRQVMVDIRRKVIRQDVVFHGDQVFGNNIADAEVQNLADGVHAVLIDVTDLP